MQTVAELMKTLSRAFIPKNATHRITHLTFGVSALAVVAVG